MYKRISLAALAAFMTSATAATAMAADLAPPPPPAPAPQIRSSINDWTGPYAGAVLGGTCMETTSTHHNTVENGTDANNNGTLEVPAEWDGTSVLNQVRGPFDMNGCGLTGGFLGGFNYQIGDVVVGIEGDWVWGGNVGRHNDGNESDRYDIDWMASIRPRAGLLYNDDTLFYVTGGPAWIRGELSDVGTGTGYKRTHFGYAIGGGIEHALTENIHIRGEYMFTAYKAKTYGTYCATCSTDGNPDTATVNVEQKMQQFHTFRLGVTWNFPVSSW